MRSAHEGPVTHTGVTAEHTLLRRMVILDEGAGVAGAAGGGGEVSEVRRTGTVGNDATRRVGEAFRRGWMSFAFGVGAPLPLEVLVDA